MDIVVMQRFYLQFLKSIKIIKYHTQKRLVILGYHWTGTGVLEICANIFLSQWNGWGRGKSVYRIYETNETRPFVDQHWLISTQLWRGMQLKYSQEGANIKVSYLQLEMQVIQSKCLGNRWHSREPEQDTSMGNWWCGKCHWLLIQSWQLPTNACHVCLGKRVGWGYFHRSPHLEAHDRHGRFPNRARMRRGEANETSMTSLPVGSGRKMISNGIGKNRPRGTKFIRGGWLINGCWIPPEMVGDLPRWALAVHLQSSVLLQSRTNDHLLSQSCQNTKSSAPCRTFHLKFLAHGRRFSFVSVASTSKWPINNIITHQSTLPCRECGWNFKSCSYWFPPLLKM